MDTRRPNEKVWGWCGLVLLVLGALDWIASHLALQAYHLGNRDRAFTLLILGAVAFGTSAVLHELAALRKEISLLGAHPENASGTN
jgi:hypothetical protein